MSYKVFTIDLKAEKFRLSSKLMLNFESFIADYRVISLLLLFFLENEQNSPYVDLLFNCRCHIGFYPVSKV